MTEQAKQHHPTFGEVTAHGSGFSVDPERVRDSNLRGLEEAHEATNPDGHLTVSPDLKEGERPPTS